MGNPFHSVIGEAEDQGDQLNSQEDRIHQKEDDSDSQQRDAKNEDDGFHGQFTAHHGPKRRIDPVRFEIEGGAQGLNETVGKKANDERRQSPPQGGIQVCKSHPGQTGRTRDKKEVRAKCDPQILQKLHCLVHVFSSRIPIPDEYSMSEVTYPPGSLGRFSARPRTLRIAMFATEPDVSIRNSLSLRTVPIREHARCACVQRSRNSPSRSARTEKRSSNSPCSAAANSQRGML